MYRVEPDKNSKEKDGSSTAYLITTTMLSTDVGAFKGYLAKQRNGWLAHVMEARFSLSIDFNKIFIFMKAISLFSGHQYPSQR